MIPPPSPPADEWGELAAYLGDRFSPEHAARTTDLVATEFRDYGELADFYRSSHAYLYDLTQFSLSGTKDPYRALIRLLLEPGARILDYGCGIGSDGLRLIEAGYDVTFADFDNPSTAYLRWRLEQRRLACKVLDVERLPEDLEFDLVYSFDVLEHVEDPVAFLERLEAMGSIVAVNFIVEEHSDDFPMHFTHDWDALLGRIAAEHTLLFDSFLYPNSQLIVYAVGKVDAKPLLSVVLPTRDRAVLLEQVLSSLVGQTLPRAAFEVLPVDDGSTDDSAAILARAPFPLPSLSSGGRGPATARNVGLSASSAPLVLFLDDDVVPAANLLEEHVLFHLRSPACEEAALGYVDWAEGETTPFMRYIAGRGGELFAWDHIRGVQQLEFRFFYTCNLSLKRQLLADERFDEGFPHAAYEDIELAYRLTRDRGLRLRFLPSAVGFHHDRKAFESFELRQRRAGESAVYFAAKHPELAEMLQVTAPFDERAAQIRLAEINAAVEAIEAIELGPLAAVRDGAVGADAIVSRWLESLYGEALRLSYLAGIASARGESGTPSTAAEWHRQAIHAHDQGQSRRAAIALGHALQLERTPERLNDLAVITAALGDHDGAHRLLEECLLLAPDDDAARENLAALHALALAHPDRS